MNASNLRTRDVWAHNLDEECTLIREIVSAYPFVAMDTEFPGIVSNVDLSFLSLSKVLISRLHGQSGLSSTSRNFSTRLYVVTWICSN